MNNYSCMVFGEVDQPVFQGHDSLNGHISKNLTNRQTT
jgi:hypothetical protein